MPTSCARSAPNLRATDDRAHRSRYGAAHGPARTDTYDITGADVLQVIDWAQRQAGDRLTYAVALVRDDVERERRNPGCGRGLVWLVGADGNETTEEQSAGREVQRRMLRRRVDPVGVPEADRAPASVPNPYGCGSR